MQSMEERAKVILVKFTQDGIDVYMFLIMTVK